MLTVRTKELKSFDLGCLRPLVDLDVKLVEGLLLAQADIGF